MLKQPGFISWKSQVPGLNLDQAQIFRRPVEWDGTMNMPILDLADNDHKRGSRDWNLR